LAEYSDHLAHGSPDRIIGVVASDLPRVNGEYFATISPNVRQCCFLDCQAPREPIQFVNDQGVCFARLDGFQRGGQTRSLAWIKTSRKTLIAKDKEQLKILSRAPRSNRVLLNFQPQTFICLSVSADPQIS